jgi:hypothetical protein
MFCGLFGASRMWLRAGLFVTLAAVGGAAAGLARSDSEQGQQFRAFLTQALSPVADVSASVSNGQFYAPDANTGAPTSPLESFAKSADFAACVQAEGPDLAKTINRLAGLHEHITTAHVVGCLLDRNPQRFCNAAGRKQVADAMEIYLWSRAEALRNPSKQALPHKLDHLEDDTAVGPDYSQPGYDPHAKAWDGPEDHAVLDSLQRLARGGYIDADAFGMFPRREIREALTGITAQYSPCPKEAAQTP